MLRVLSAALQRLWDYRRFVEGENAEDDRQEAIRLIDESIEIFKKVSCLNGSYSMYYCVGCDKAY